MNTPSNLPLESRPGSHRTEPPVVSLSAVKKQGSSHKSCFVVGCGLTGGILILLGLVGWLGYRFLQNAKGDTHYHTSQIPIGGEMPDWVQEDMQTGEPVELEKIDGLAEFLDQLASEQLDEESAINYRRAVLEMEATGLCPEVNLFTRRSWERGIQNAISLPNLGEEFKVIGLDWTIPDKELRLAVLINDYSTFRINYLYLCNQNGTWQMYDRRDPESPASECQYLALFAQARNDQRDNLWMMNERQNEIYDRTDIDAEAKSQLTVEAYREKNYPNQMRWMAIDNTLAWLLSYENADAMFELLLEPDQGDFVGLEIYRAQMLLWQDKRAEAFQAAMLAIGRLSWHPEATRLAFLAAETPEEIAQVAPAFERLEQLLPKAAMALFEEADVARLQQWSQHWSQSEAGIRRLLAMAIAIRDTDKLSAMRSTVLTPSNPHQELLLNYLSIRQSAADKKLDLPTAAYSIMHSPVRSLLESDGDQTSEALSLIEQIQWLIVNYLSSRDDLIKLSEIDTEHQLLRKLRDRLAGGHRVKSWEQALQLIQSGDEQFLSESSTQVALGTLYQQLEQLDQAWSILSNVWREVQETAISDQSPDYVTNLVTRLSWLAAKSDRVPEFCELIDIPELAILSLFNSMSNTKQWQGWSQLSHWYLQRNGQPDVWHYLAESHYHYVQGDWQAAEASMPKAVELAEEDSRFENHDFPEWLEPWIPYEELPSEWSSYHARMAFRSGNLLKWMENRRDDPEAMLAEMEEVLRVLRYLSEEKLTEDVLKYLEDFGGASDQTKSWIHALRASRAEQRGEFELSVKERFEELKLNEDAQYYIPPLLRLALYHGVDWRQWRAPLEELTKEYPEGQAFIKQAAAISSGNTEEFLELVKSDHDWDVMEDWKYRLGCIALQKAGAWKEFNRFSPHTMRSIHSLKVNASVIVMDQSATELLDELPEKLSERYGEGLQTIPLSRFPFATGAWTVDISKRRFLLVAYDRSNLQDHVTGLQFLEEYPGYLAVAQLSSPREQRFDSEQRKFAADFGKQWPQAKGYFDNWSDSRFVGENWHVLLRENADTGCNPRDFVFYDHYPYYEDVENKDSDSTQTVFIRCGLILEEVEVEPVEVDASVDETKEDGTVVRLKVAPLSCPLLSAGDRLKFDD